MATGDEMIETLVGALTLKEKCLLLSGKNMWETFNVDRLGIPSLKTTDGPAGVRGATWTDGTHTTYIPCGIALASTFDPELIERVGAVLGTEARSKAAHVLLAPTMNISRSPLGGRNFENFGEDPFLTGVMSAGFIRGVQSQGVAACMKHFVANDMETRRFNMDQQIDERTLREIYLKPFQMAVQLAQPWASMTSYPKVNGTHVDANEWISKDILRDEWSFEGLSMSDWGGLNSTIDSARAGTDLEMPGPPIRYGAALQAAVELGEVSETDHIDASVRRLLKLLSKLKLLGEKAESNNAWNEKDSDTPEFRQTARDAATGGIVLLKNQNILPLRLSSLRKLAIIGPNAKKPTTGGTGSAAVNPYYITTPYESISEAVRTVNPDIEISYAQGIFTHLQPPLPGAQLKTPDGKATGIQLDFYAGHNFEGEVVASSHWQNSVVFLMSDGDTPAKLRGKPFCYRARGILTPAKEGTYELSLSNTGSAKLFLDDQLIIDNSKWTKTGGSFMNCGSANRLATMSLEARPYIFRIDNVAVPPPLPPHDNTLFLTVSGLRAGVELKHDEEAMFIDAVSTAGMADAVVLVVGHNNDTEKEGIDRTSLILPRRTDELVAAVCAANLNTVVVTQSACAISMPWSKSAPAIVHAWYQGQENGNALADVLLGKVNPSGKLPLTFPVRLEDHGSHEWFPGDAARDYAEYGEGVLVGYRWFDNRGTRPLWPFGFGLSYTTFEIVDGKVDGNVAADGSKKTMIMATVKNTGTKEGSEVVQVYASPSLSIKKYNRPCAPKSLVGFSKVSVLPGESKTVSVEIGREAFAWFDVEGKGGPGSGGKWRVDAGTYTCYLGRSSRDIAIELDVQVT